METISYCNECGEAYIDDGLGCPDCDWQGDDDEVTDEDVNSLLNQNKGEQNGVI